MALVFVFLYAPIVLLIVFSFNCRQQQHGLEGLLPALVHEAVPATGSSCRVCTPPCWCPCWPRIIATVAGTFAAIGFYSHAPPVAARPLMTVNNIPMMNADIVTGVSMCLLFVAFFGGWGSLCRLVQQAAGLLLAAGAS